jgi:hypothetical protein
MFMRIDAIDECSMVDELAALKAQLAPLLAREEALKDYFKSAGKERYIGTEHEAVIIPATRYIADTEKLKDHFGLNDKAWKASPWVKQSDSFSCKLSGRKLVR